MAHQPLPLPPPPDDDDNDFDTSDVTKTRIRGVDAEIYIGGVERALNAVAKQQVEGHAKLTDRVDALLVEVREAGDATKQNTAAIEALTDEMRKFMKFALEERGERFKLADRVSTLEQPRKRARRK